MKDLDLSQFTEQELVALNHRVVERIKMLRQARLRASMTELQIGDRVSFQHECGHEIVGTIVRLNQKSVTVVSADEGRWRVAPVLLKRLESGQPPAERAQADLIDLAAHRRNHDRHEP